MSHTAAALPCARRGGDTAPYLEEAFTLIEVMIALVAFGLIGVMLALAVTFEHKKVNGRPPGAGKAA